MSTSDKTQFRVRVYLPTGLTCTLNLYGENTFGDLRNQVWEKKSSLGCTKSEARFRLYTTEIYFSDSDNITKLVSIYPSFEGLGLVDRYSLLLESPHDIGDKSMREKMKINSKKPIFWQGYLMKCSKPTGKGFWKKIYVVFQNQTLMMYSNQDDFNKGKKASKYITMGSIVPQLDHHSCRNANKKFPVVLDVARGKGTKPGIYVFGGESDAVRRSFVDTIMKFLYYRRCSMILNILPCLYRNDYASTTGIFRIAGESTKIKAMQENIDDGLIPNFNKIITPKTIHNLTGLLKRQLRFMLSPIIPETHYEAFIDIGRQLTNDKRIEQLHFVIKSLPSTSVVVLSELFKFLHFAINYQDVSKMGPTNFAIVIGPNILRTDEENINPMKAIDDNKHMQTTVATMITDYDKILPSLTDLYKFDKATSPKWKYGVIESDSNHDIQHKQPNIKQIKSSSSSSSSSGGFGLFELAKNVGASASMNSDTMKQLSASSGNIRKTSLSKKKYDNHNNDEQVHRPSSAKFGVPPPTMSQIGDIKLKSTNKKPKELASSTTNTIDFRAHLKKRNVKTVEKKKFHKTDDHSFDFRAQMKQKKRPTSSSTVPPKNLNEQLNEFQSEANNGSKSKSISISNSNEMPEPSDLAYDISATSPKLPPPNPIEMMNKEEQISHRENEKILQVFQDFEDKMAQFDEEIDFKQSFAESIVTQIMELAENGKVIDAGKHAQKLDTKCKMVIDAAKAHSEALQNFNQMLQNIYSQMEDAIEQKNKSGKTPIPVIGKITAGGPSSSSLTVDNNKNEGGGGLPHAYQYSLDFEEMDDFKNNEKSNNNDHSQKHQRYDSAKNLHKKEPEKKVAKALFDYPGGYRTNELTFHRGTSLLITKEKEGWVYGHYELEPTLTGWFPKSYVQIISGH